MTAIAATSYTSRILVDGTLAMTIHIDPPFRDAAIALFGAPGSEMALAALQCAKAAPAVLEAAPQAAKGGERARWVGIRCQEPGFQRWLQEAFPAQWEAAPGTTPTLWAVGTVRAACGIKSRVELDSDATAASRFDLLIRKPYGAGNEK